MYTHPVARQRAIRGVHGVARTAPRRGARLRAAPGAGAAAARLPGEPEAPGRGPEALLQAAEAAALCTAALLQVAALASCMPAAAGRRASAPSAGEAGASQPQRLDHQQHQQHQQHHQRQQMAEVEADAPSPPLAAWPPPSPLAAAQGLAVLVALACNAALRRLQWQRHAPSRPVLGSCGRGASVGPGDRLKSPSPSPSPLPAARGPRRARGRASTLPRGWSAWRPPCSSRPRPRRRPRGSWTSCRRGCALRRLTSRLPCGRCKRPAPARRTPSSSSRSSSRPSRARRRASRRSSRRCRQSGRASSRRAGWGRLQGLAARPTTRGARGGSVGMHAMRPLVRARSGLVTAEPTNSRVCCHRPPAAPPCLAPGHAALRPRHATRPRRPRHRRAALRAPQVCIDAVTQLKQQQSAAAALHKAQADAARQQVEALGERIAQAQLSQQQAAQWRAAGGNGNGASAPVGSGGTAPDPWLNR
jgi:hypothetical protein